jgi:hypothetical protein
VVSDDGRPAISLLSGVRRLEEDLARPWTHSALRPFTSISWDDVGTKVYAPTWAETRARHDAQLTTVAIEDLAERMPSLLERLVPAVLAEGETASREEAVSEVVWALGSVLADALVRAGWTIHADIGEPIVLRGPSGALDPFHAVGEMARRQLDPAAWRRQCADLGIVGMSLGRAAGDA